MPNYSREIANSPRCYHQRRTLGLLACNGNHTIPSSFCQQY